MKSCSKFTSLAGKHFHDIYENFITVKSEITKWRMEECSMENDVENEEDVWDIDWDLVVTKIEEEIRKYDAPRITHAEIFKAPMIY